MTGVLWPIGPFCLSLVVNSSDSRSHLGCFHLRGLTKPLVWVARQ